MPFSLSSFYPISYTVRLRDGQALIGQYLEITAAPGTTNNVAVREETTRAVFLSWEHFATVIGSAIVLTVLTAAQITLATARVWKICSMLSNLQRKSLDKKVRKRRSQLIVGN